MVLNPHQLLDTNQSQRMAINEGEFLAFTCCLFFGSMALLTLITLDQDMGGCDVQNNARYAQRVWDKAACQLHYNKTGQNVC